MFFSMPFNRPFSWCSFAKYDEHGNADEKNQCDETKYEHPL